MKPIEIINGDLKFNTTEVFEKNLNALNSDKTIIVNQGAARSSKTFSILQLLFYLALQNYYNNIKHVFSIVRATMPSLRTSVMRDFFQILDDLNLYDKNCHSKSNDTYVFYGNLFEFFSVQDFNRVKGRQRDWLWLNEGDEFEYDEFNQLNMRTSQKSFIDFNPNNPYSYIFEKLQNDKDSIFIKSTIFDNPFAPQRQKNEILKLKTDNPELWKVYGLGEKAMLSNLVYNNWSVGDVIHENEIFYGLDFGFNNPTAMVECSFSDNTFFVKQKLYQSKITNSELINFLKDNVNKGCYIWADSAEPQRIEEIKKAGFNIRSSDKSVKDGLDFVKRFKLVIDRNSSDLIKEIKNYSYKEINGRLTEEPVKFMDHQMDALRYAIFNYGKQFLNKNKKLIYNWE